MQIQGKQDHHRIALEKIESQLLVSLSCKSSGFREKSEKFKIHFFSHRHTRSYLHSFSCPFRRCNPYSARWHILGDTHNSYTKAVTRKARPPSDSAWKNRISIIGVFLPLGAAVVEKLVILWLGGDHPNLPQKPPGIARPPTHLKPSRGQCNPWKHRLHFLHHRWTYGKNTRELFGALFPQLSAGVVRFSIFPSVLEREKKKSARKV